MRGVRKDLCRGYCMRRWSWPKTYQQDAGGGFKGVLFSNLEGNIDPICLAFFFFKMSCFNHQLEIQGPILCEFFFSEFATTIRLKPQVLYRYWVDVGPPRLTSRVPSLIVPKSPPGGGSNHHEWCWKTTGRNFRNRKLKQIWSLTQLFRKEKFLRPKFEWETVEKSGLRTIYAVFLLSYGGICGGNGVLFSLASQHYSAKTSIAWSFCCLPENEHPVKVSGWKMIVPFEMVPFLGGRAFIFPCGGGEFTVTIY